MDVDRLLDPDVAEALASVPMNMRELSTETLATFRSVAPPASDPPEGVVRRELLVPAGDGESPDVPIRMFLPAEAVEPIPALLWIHGGGFVLGSAAMDDARLGGWAERFECVAVGVDYRLAPETPFPGPFDDCYAALRWLHVDADVVGLDRNRVGVGGISAGGGLAAAVALAARDRAELPVAFQCLVYPMLDDRMANPSSGWDSTLWPPSANRFGWSAYLGDLAGADVSPYAAPARATELRELPPTFLGVGALDGFLDEDVTFALALAHAGVHVELHVYPGGCHGLDSVAPQSRPGMQLRRDVEDWLGRALRSGQK